NAEQTEAARELGRQRARQGVPVEAVIGAYHIGYRELWNVLLARADAYGTGLGERLVRLVNLVWTWVSLVSSASADAHAETVRSQQAWQISIGHRFLDALRAGDDAAEETAFMARALGFDPDGTFQALCAPLSGPLERPEERIEPLRRRLEALPGIVRAAVRGTLLLIVAQDAASEAILATVHDVLPKTPLGIGLRREGLGGAVASIVDGELALAGMAPTQGTVFFEEEWLAATLFPQRRRLVPLLRHGPDMAVSYPHLADAVRAFAHNGFSVTASARALHVHPNTVKYRLDRWQALTGWDPRTHDGLTRSLLSLKLYGGSV
ncbi:PucR family transcriptional regulator, partial [Actinomadura adrarensis]